MENILFFNSRTVFIISIASFCASLLLRNASTAAPGDFLAPVATGIYNLLSSGFYYMAIGCLVLAVIKFIYEWAVGEF